MQKKFGWIAIALVLLIGLLTGCGQTVESKVHELQEKNDITTKDVVMLMELEGLTVKAHEPSAAFREQWPKAELYTVSDGTTQAFFLLQDLGADTWNRESIIAKMGWNRLHFYTQEAPDPLAKQLKTDFALEGEYQWLGQQVYAKNLLGCYLIPWEVSQLVQLEDSEEQRQNFTAQLEQFEALQDIIRRVFWTDINDIQQVACDVQGEAFSVDGTVAYYATPYEMERGSVVDCYAAAELTLHVNDEVFDRYQGQQVSITYAGPTDMRNSQTTQSGVLMEQAVPLQVRKTQSLLGGDFRGPLEYLVTLQVGDLEETVTVTINVSK